MHYFSSWQDAVFFFANVVFGLTLIPVLANPKARVPRICSIPTAIAVAAMGLTCFTIHLYLGGVANLINAGLWALIATYRPIAR